MIRIPGNGMIMAVRMYQVCISPMLGSNCRYQPTCSAYFIEAVRKYGAIRGGWKGTCRICRCHPFCEGGYDPP
ncbi:MAG: membrane protein insertion efficiency factor YidD [Mariniblastus sp.]|nr:membrane protein insertion efficiency factor YidD [Mariniblastus sp.]